MSQPSSVKWIPPFREILARGFQTLPLTLAGTSAFFAATTTAPFFIVLTVVLIAVLPALIYLTQFAGGFLHRTFEGQPRDGFAKIILLASIFLGVAVSTGNAWGTPDNAATFIGKHALEILTLFGLFVGNSMWSSGSKVAFEAPSLPCQLVGIAADSRPGPVPIAPSFWLTPVVFLSVYLFHNAIDNYSKPVGETANKDKVTKRKIQSVFAMISIPIVALLLLTFRMYTGCETLISMLTSVFLGTFVAEYFYDMARDSGVDAFMMFQNLQMGIRRKDYRCFAEI